MAVRIRLEAVDGRTVEFEGEDAYLDQDGTLVVVGVKVDG